MLPWIDLDIVFFIDPLGCVDRNKKILIFCCESTAPATYIGGRVFGVHYNEHLCLLVVTKKLKCHVATFCLLVFCIFFCCFVSINKQTPATKERGIQQKKNKQLPKNKINTMKKSSTNLTLKNM